MDLSELAQEIQKHRCDNINPGKDVLESLDQARDQLPILRNA